MVTVYIRSHYRLLFVALLALATLVALYTVKLGSLVSGLSLHENITSTQAVGWHGIAHDPLYLPLKLVRSVVFAVSPDHGQTLTRLPNVIFGVLAVISLSAIVRIWHGKRTAAYISVLFATSAWSLHVSRVATFDVLYLWAIPALLLSHLLLQKYSTRLFIVVGSVITWGLLLYVPGMIWLLIVSIYTQRSVVRSIWTFYKLWWQRSLLAGLAIVWLPLLLYRLATSASMLKTWAGLPQHFDSLVLVLKHFVAVPVHLLIRGPQYPEIWLGRHPILDIFTLVLALVGIYFYRRHWQSSRSRLVGSYGFVGFLLVGIGGAASLSLLVPMLYIFASMGLAYLLHDWLKIFPRNPLARTLGIGLVSTAVLLSIVLNTRAYFVAWPHNAETKATFQYHR